MTVSGDTNGVVRKQIPRKGEFLEPEGVVELTLEAKTEKLKIDLLNWYKKNEGFSWAFLTMANSIHRNFISANTVRKSKRVFR